MGCDIHASIEARKNKKLKEWIAVNQNVDIPRSYSLFTALAGVRNRDEGIIVISKPRGIPDDVSEGHKEEHDYWGSDGHSDSWLTFSELHEYVHANKNDNFDIRGYSFYQEMDRYADRYGADNVRLVFLFDN